MLQQRAPSGAAWLSGPGGPPAAAGPGTSAGPLTAWPAGAAGAPGLTMPPSGDPGVCAAVALGWQVAQLFHTPVHRGPVTDPPRGDHLPGRSEFPGASQSLWLGEQIQAQAQALLGPPPPVVLDALAGVRAALANPHRAPGATLDLVFTLHCRLLEALTVTGWARPMVWAARWPRRRCCPPPRPAAPTGHACSAACCGWPADHHPGLARRPEDAAAQSRCLRGQPQPGRLAALGR